MREKATKTKERYGCQRNENEYKRMIERQKNDSDS
jgi:hypothetical protein